MTGFIKDHRKELESDIWLMPPIYHRVWQYLKYMVNHKDNEIPMRDGGRKIIKRGQHLTSIRGISKGVGYYELARWKEPNPKTVSSILDWLEKQGMIAIDKGEGNRQYTLITLINWDLYQVREVEGNSEYTPKKQCADINKNDKERLKNEKEIKKTSRHKYKPCDMDNANLLFSLMEINNPNVKKPNFEKWANDFRLMREMDNRTNEQIKFLIDWTQKDSFWKSNILSPSKLREKYDALVLRVKEEREKQNGQTRGNIKPNAFEGRGLGEKPVERKPVEPTDLEGLI